MPLEYSTLTDQLRTLIVGAEMDDEDILSQDEWRRAGMRFCAVIIVLEGIWDMCMREGTDPDGEIASHLEEAALDSARAIAYLYWGTRGSITLATEDQWKDFAVDRLLSMAVDEAYILRTAEVIGDCMDEMAGELTATIPELPFVKGSRFAFLIQGDE